MKDNWIRDEGTRKLSIGSIQMRQRQHMEARQCSKANVNRPGESERSLIVTVGSFQREEGSNTRIAYLCSAPLYKDHQTMDTSSHRNTTLDLLANAAEV